MQKIGLASARRATRFSPGLLADRDPGQPPTTAAAPAVETITLGNAVVALTGPWKFQPGDSPVVNGAPLWAQPQFDDSRWTAMDLTTKDGAVNLILGTSGYVPGWTSKGYPNLSGYAWYRLRLRVKDASQPLWLKMPLDFDDAYQVYANGRYLGQFGDFSKSMSPCTTPNPSPSLCPRRARTARSTWPCAST